MFLPQRTSESLAKTRENPWRSNTDGMKPWEINCDSKANEFRSYSTIMQLRSMHQSKKSEIKKEKWYSGRKTYSQGNINDSTPHAAVIRNQTEERVISRETLRRLFWRSRFTFGEVFWFSAAGFTFINVYIWKWNRRCGVETRKRDESVVCVYI